MAACQWFLCDVLRNGGGELPVDLYTALELQGRLGFFVDKQEAYTGYSLKKYFSQSDVFIRILNVSDNRKSILSCAGSTRPCMPKYGQA